MKTKGVRNHELVYEALQAAGSPVSAYHLLHTLRVHGFNAPPDGLPGPGPFRARGAGAQAELG
jgi:hypothetical protein